MYKQQVLNLPIDINDIRSLSKLNPVRSLIALVSEWLLIALAIGFHLYFAHPVVYLVSWVLIGSRMYALYSLLHDGIHFLLFPNKQVNDALCRIFLAGPLFISLPRMRKFHLEHHRYLKTEDDPEAKHLQYSEFQFPKPAFDLALTFLKDISGINFLYYKSKKLINLLRSFLRKKNRDDVNKTKELIYGEPEIFLYYSIIGIFFLYMGWGLLFLLYWIVPYITIYQAINRLRLSTEHFNIAGDKIFQTRTVKLNLIERFFLSPHNLGFHTEHHLYPSVPFYRLPSLHRSLMNVSEFQNNVVVKSSYLTVIRDFIKR